MTRKLLCLALMLSAAAAWALDSGTRKDVTPQADKLPALSLETMSSAPGPACGQSSEADQAIMSLTTESKEGVRVAQSWCPCLCQCGRATSACHAGCSTNLSCHQACDRAYQDCIRTCN